MFDGQYLYGFDADAIDEHIVGGDDCLARIGSAPGAVHIGMIGQTFGGIFEQFGQAKGGGGIAVGNIAHDPARILPRLRAPSDVGHQACLAFLASMIARSSAMT